MVDTLKFKIPLSEKQFKLIQGKSCEITKTNNQNNVVEFRIINYDLEIGSYDKKITIKIFDDQYALLELSLPKFYLGNNVELLYPSQVEEALRILQNKLQEHFGDFPPYMKWSIERLDLCYGWKYDSQAFVINALSILKTFDYPRKSKYLYKESVMWKGPYYSLKFYLKQPEFIKHDYHRLKRANIHEFADRILALSDGVLRFEITIRKEQIKYIFDKKIVTYKELLNKINLEHIMGEYVSNLLLHLDHSVMDEQQVLLRLRSKNYSKRKVMALFSFYKLYLSPKLNYRQIYKDTYNNSTIWRYKKYLSEAGVGLPQLDLPINFSLEIPSRFVVNSDPSNSRVSENA
jgi:hypothetical protein